MQLKQPFNSIKRPRLLIRKKKTPQIPQIHVPLSTPRCNFRYSPSNEQAYRPKSVSSYLTNPNHISLLPRQIISFSNQKQQQNMVNVSGNSINIYPLQNVKFTANIGKYPIVIKRQQQLIQSKSYQNHNNFTQQRKQLTHQPSKKINFHQFNSVFDNSSLYGINNLSDQQFSLRTRQIDSHRRINSTKQQTQNYNIESLRPTLKPNLQRFQRHNETDKVLQGQLRNLKPVENYHQLSSSLSFSKQNQVNKNLFLNSQQIQNVLQLKKKTKQISYTDQMARARQKNKTSFDRQIPDEKKSILQPSVKVLNQDLNYGLSQANENNTDTFFNSKLGVRKIHSLFANNHERSSKELDQNQLANSDGNLKINKLQFNFMQLLPQQMQNRKLTVYSRHFSEYAEEDDKQQQANFSFSLEELPSEYQDQRQIMLTYLESLKKKSIKRLKNQNQNQKFQFDNQESQIQTIAFLQFINSLRQLEEQKYSDAKLNKYSINLAHYHHHGNIRHHQNHFHNYHFHHHSHYHQHQEQLGQNLKNKPQLQYLINIGQNPQEIHENKMIIHFVSVWLKQMNYLKEETRIPVIQNIKTLFLESFQSFEDHSEVQTKNYLNLDNTFNQFKNIQLKKSHDMHSHTKEEKTNRKIIQSNGFKSQIGKISQIRNFNHQSQSKQKIEYSHRASFALPDNKQEKIEKSMWLNENFEKQPNSQIKRTIKKNITQNNRQNDLPIQSYFQFQTLSQGFCQNFDQARGNQCYKKLLKKQVNRNNYTSGFYQKDANKAESNLRHSQFYNSNQLPPQSKPSSLFAENSIDALISDIYVSMYHKLLPVELQLLIVLNLCRRGWKFFELITVKILRAIYFSDLKQNQNQEQTLYKKIKVGNIKRKENEKKRLQKKLEKIIIEFINE